MIFPSVSQRHSPQAQVKQQPQPLLASLNVSSQLLEDPDNHHRYLLDGQTVNKTSHKSLQELSA
jgi:hypothetical protein